jgi:hypothetical protein
MAGHLYHETALDGVRLHGASLDQRLVLEEWNKVRVQVEGYFQIMFADNLWRILLILMFVI